jgi:putative endonuclease
MSQYCVSIVASQSRVLYTGVTADLEHRVWQHKTKAIPGFSAKYQANRLVWFEATPNSRVAIQREKQIKGWKREKKIRGIESMDPQWMDLAENWS